MNKIVVLLVLCLMVTTLSGCFAKKIVYNEIKKQLIEYLPELVTLLFGLFTTLVSMAFAYVRKILRENVKDIEIRESVNRAVVIAEKKMRDYLAIVCTSMKDELVEQVQVFDFNKPAKGQLEKSIQHIINAIKKAEAEAIAGAALPKVEKNTISRQVEISVELGHTDGVGSLDVKNASNIPHPTWRSQEARELIDKLRKKVLKSE